MSPAATRLEIDDSELTPVLLLGAGASAEAGIPTAFEMTRTLANAIGHSGRTDNDGRPTGVAAVFNFVCAAILAHDAAEGVNASGDLDVERVFAAVQLLAERRRLEVAPFIAAWNPAVDRWDPDGDIYEALARRMIGALDDCVSVARTDVQYLRPIAQLARSRSGLTVATLNYDRTVELAASATSVGCETGIEAWSSEGRWSWPTGGIRLLKLHGSIDWYWRYDAGQPGRLAQRLAGSWNGKGADLYGRRTPALLFGHRTKLNAEGPFLSLLAEFEAQLAGTDHLIALGYSFRDDHINTVVRRWASDDEARRITIVDPNFPDYALPRTERIRPEADFQDDFRRELAERLVPWNETAFAPRLRVVRKTTSAALADLAGDPFRRRGL